MRLCDQFAQVYDFIAGPMMWLAVILFVAGSVYRIGKMFYLINRRERFIYSYFNFFYSLRSIVRWLLPFGTTSWRMHPVVTVFTFIFHLCLLILPVFLTAHVVMLDTAWNIGWPTLPESVADVLTVIVIVCCLFFLIRRLSRPEVRYLTTASDYLLLLIAAAPFITGFLAYHQAADYRLWVALHMLSGQIMLIAIPFTRLSHMLFAVFTRAYTASEFGAVRNARDW
jgi:nitrate reductase gamma subunit